MLFSKQTVIPSKAFKPSKIKALFWNLERVGYSYETQKRPHGSNAVIRTMEKISKAFKSAWYRRRHNATTIIIAIVVILLATLRIDRMINDSALHRHIREYTIEHNITRHQIEVHGSRLHTTTPVRMESYFRTYFVRQYYVSIGAEGVMEVWIARGRVRHSGGRRRLPHMWWGRRWFWWISGYARSGTRTL